MIPITVVIPVKNEERNLPRCLKALSRFSEIIIVDSGSSDRTKEIAYSFGATVIDFRWDGRYPKKRNWVLINRNLRHEWVLFLDADEVVNEEFCIEVVDAIMYGKYSGYWLNYTNYFMGRRLRYGVPQKKLALFKIGSGLYERIDENGWSGLDMEVHEHPIIEGDVGEIKSSIEHNDFRGLAKFIERHLDYARWEAMRCSNLRSLGEQATASLTSRQKFKYMHVGKAWYATFYFIYTYLIRRGFLDGAAGFHYAFYKAWYFHTIRLLIVEARNR